MAEFYSYEGLRNGGTYKLDSTTVTAIKDKPMDIVGKVVTVTDNYTVGYGSSGNRPLGFVEMVEKESNSSTDLVVSVVWNRSRENTVCSGSETAGDYLACDGSGGLKTSATATNAVAWGVESTDKTCTAYIHG